MKFRRMGAFAGLLAVLTASASNPALADFRAANTSYFPKPVVFKSTVTVPAGNFPRTSLTTQLAQIYRIPLTADVKNLAGTTLAASAGAGVFGISTPASFGAGSTGPALLGEAANTNTKTDVCIFEVPVPPEYVAGGNITINIYGAITGSGTIGSTKTLTVDVYDMTTATSVASANLGPSAATWAAPAANYPFVVTSTAVVPGDKLFVQVQSAVAESAGTNIVPTIYDINVAFDIAG